MMRRRWSLGLLIALALSTPSRAASPPSIRSFSVVTIERLGREMARKDAAAWVASDALQLKVADPAAEHLRGWIVEDTSTGQRVRFLRDDGHGLEVGFDVDVTPDLKTTVSQPADRTVTSEERAQFNAWFTAATALRGVPTCGSNYNHVVLRDPEGEGWLVWLLAPIRETGTIPVGGHYRFSVSSDGLTITRRDALSASCYTVPKPDSKRGSIAAVFVTHVVSPTPVETHVFVQLQNGTPMLVGAGDHVWLVDAGHVEDRGPIKDLGRGAP